MVKSCFDDMQLELIKDGGVGVGDVEYGTRAGCDGGEAAVGGVEADGHVKEMGGCMAQ